jgi:hypothetical protein
MPPSTLKLYIEIAKTLNEYGPLSVHDLESFLKVNSSTLNKPIKFFCAQRMIKEKSSNLITTYIITKRGIEILKFFKVQPLIKVANNKN